MASSGFVSASPRWHNWVEKHPVGGIALIGVIATQLGTYFGYVFPAVGLPVLPWPAYNGALIGAAAGDQGASWASPISQYFAGQSLHFINGVVFAMLFAFLAHAKLPGKHVQKGLIYGVIMTIVSVGLLVPYAYVPKMGYGLFLFDGPDTWKLPLGILIWHLIYGFFIGTLYQPKDEN